MKNYYWLSIFIFAFSANAHSYQPKVEIIEQFDNLKMVAFINMEDVNNIPKWMPGNNAPPLTVAEAIEAVNSFNNMQKTTKPIAEIEIRQIPKHKGNWHYLIKVTNNTMKSKYDIYVVLMSGKVIPAIIEPQSYK